MTRSSLVLVKLGKQLLFLNQSDQFNQYNYCDLSGFCSNRSSMLIKALKEISVPESIFFFKIDKEKYLTLHIILSPYRHFFFLFIFMLAPS